MYLANLFIRIPRRTTYFRKISLFFCSVGIPKFKNFKLSDETERALESMNIFTPSPIQELALPKILSNPQSHYFIAAQTGTGKTLTYLIPLLENLKKLELKHRASLAFDENSYRITLKNRPSAIIVVPSKELVEQVTKVVKSFCHFIKFKAVGFSSNTSFSEEKGYLDEGIDILIATPNRVDRHLKIDEADTLIEAGFSEEIKKFCQIFIDTKKTSATFVSATMSNSLRRFFDDTFGKSHNFIKIVEKNTHYNLTNVNHEFIHVMKLDKHEPFMKLMREITPQMNKLNGSLMIFCNSIPCCHSLEYKLKDEGFDCVSLHGDVPLKLRNQNYNRFLSRTAKILISTDLGSRGLDFPFLSHVINFDFPRNSTDYLHRAGRTGRAGNHGNVYSFYHNKDQKVIDELKESHENQQPLRIENSAFSMINKEILKKKNKDEVNHLIEERKRLPGKELQLHSSRVSQTKALESKRKLRGYIPERDKQKDKLKGLIKRESKVKKYERIQFQKRTRAFESRIDRLKRKIKGRKTNK